MSSYLIGQIRSKENIFVETSTTVTEVFGETHIEAVSTHSEVTGDTRQRRADGLFVFIGTEAATDWLPAGIMRDAHGHICTGQHFRSWNLERHPFPLETSIPGIFAAGDVRSGSVRRVASSVGEGAMAISFIHEFLETAGTPRMPPKGMADHQPSPELHPARRL